MPQGTRLGTVSAQPGAQEVKMRAGARGNSVPRTESGYTVRSAARGTPWSGQVLYLSSPTYHLTIKTAPGLRKNIPSPAAG